MAAIDRDACKPAGLGFCSTGKGAAISGTGHAWREGYICVKLSWTCLADRAETLAVKYGQLRAVAPGRSGGTGIILFARLRVLGRKDYTRRWRVSMADFDNA